jgi:serine/threonine protein kinase
LTDSRSKPPVASDAASLSPGQSLFEYRIERVLGGGGFGITYLAHDVNLQLPVAIKEYFPGDLALRASDCSVHVRSGDGVDRFQWGLERFIDEARTLATFRHPNIVRVLRYFKEHGTAYIVMEYESGDPLPRWLVKQGGLSQQKLLQVIYPILDGLEKVHQLNFLHRDIKPDNIYVRADGSPVLLDFGAARRLTLNTEMTNIVSPGFAPFEQYHSGGNQGPWTDLYSLGAVMYWMATGSKPLEAASRVREDPIKKAVSLGNTQVFCESLLQAIDWAMLPHEAERPQHVAQFRAMLQQAEQDRSQTLAVGTGPTTRLDASAVPHSASVLAFVSESRAVPTNAAEAMRKNVMGTIMFLDLVAYSTLSVNQQVVVKALFNELIAKAIAGVNESSRIVLDTGDGAAICFLGDPEEALQSALLMRDLLVQKYGQRLSMRVGLHLGPIRMMLDINNRVNVVGDGINVAQRVMDFSEPNQIVVSRAFFEVISQISDHAKGLFEFLGARLDKHKRPHDIYGVVNQGFAATRVVQPGPVGQSSLAEHRTVTLNDPVSPADVAEVEADLARAIGPLAHVLIKKALARTADLQSLRDALAVSIPDPHLREAFAHPKRSPTVPLFGASASVSSLLTRSQLLSRPTQSGVVHGASGFGPSSVPLHSAPSSQAATLLVLDQEQQSALEQALGHYVGPLAKMLVKKELARQANSDALLAALCRHIDHTQERDKFLDVAKRVLRR